MQYRMCIVLIEAKEEIKAQLKKITMQDIFTPQVELSPWVSSFTYPYKVDETIRVCLYPKDLNKTMISEQHKAHILEEITHSLADQLCILNLMLTTFNIQLGRYHFKCMAFGLKMSHDIFQMKIDQIVERSSGILCIHNDLYVHGKSENEHGSNLFNLMQVASNRGLIQLQKCQIKFLQITFYIFSKEGMMKPGHEKITEMSPQMYNNSVIFRHKFHATILSLSLTLHSTT